MPFIGNQPALSYTSFAKQDFTTSATTSYTLDHPVTNENEIALFINFVRQEPTTAYTASGTSLTLTSATSATDDMYCVFLGKAVQTVNPPNGSVGTSQLADNGVTTAKILDANITSAKLASGVLPTNTPAFHAYVSSAISVANATFQTVLFQTEYFDTDSAYDPSTGRFTVPSGEAGKYLFTFNLRRASWSSARFITTFAKNGGDVSYFEDAVGSGSDRGSAGGSVIMDLSAGDYITIKCYHTNGSAQNIEGGVGQSSQFFTGMKLIG